MRVRMLLPLAYAAIDAMTEAVGDTGHTMFLTPEQLKSSTASVSAARTGSIGSPFLNVFHMCSPKFSTTGRSVSLIQ